MYYVCNNVGDEWIQLPDVTPKQIRVARQIYKSFTGNLNEPIVTYPEFDGCEINYLRAQIARISAGWFSKNSRAGDTISKISSVKLNIFIHHLLISSSSKFQFAATQISPLGYYTFGGAMGGEGEEEEEEEEKPGGEDKTTYIVNPKYDPPALRDLTDGSMSFWVHHSQYILPQGRTTWWNPNPLPETGMDEEMGEEEEGEEKPKVAGPEPETGPPLLTPLSEDASLEAVPAWSVRPSSTLMQEHAIATVRSNLWPGAYCFATQGKLFENVYLGYGLKYNSHNFSPLPLPPVQQEYPLGPEIMEMTDPSGAEEEAWRIAHLPKPKPEKPMVGEGEEEEEEEEEEEDED